MKKAARNPLLDPVFFPKVGFDASEKIRTMCSGTKVVKCRWPHRELHEAAAALDRLISAVVAYRAITEAATYATEHKLQKPNVGKVLAELVNLADEFAPRPQRKETEFLLIARALGA